MESKIPIYNRINLIVNKTELDYLVRLVRWDKRNRNMGIEETEMTKILYSRLTSLNK